MALTRIVELDQCNIHPSKGTKGGTQVAHKESSRFAKLSRGARAQSQALASLGKHMQHLRNGLVGALGGETKERIRMTHAATVRWQTRDCLEVDQQRVLLLQ